MKQDLYKFFRNFQERTDLLKYGDNALLLYALQIKYGIEDIDDVAITSLLDGPDDKKVDLVYINTETNETIIAQGYFSKKDKQSAPANKASDLNTAVSWLFNRQLSDLPERLQSIALELRQKLNGDEIKKVTLWYVHNLLESENVAQELISAEHTLYTSIRTNFKNAKVECCSLEVGLKIIEEWYTALTIPILVTDTIKIKASGYEVTSKEWNCFNTSIPAQTIYKLYKKHGTNLFSANVRDYLGSRKSDSNINNGIKDSAEKEADNFYVYNNGITALVNSFIFEKGLLTIKGFSIVNGAQLLVQLEV